MMLLFKIERTIFHLSLIEKSTRRDVCKPCALTTLLILRVTPEIGKS
jgi:hypothetical protein